MRLTLRCTAPVRVEGTARVTDTSRCRDGFGGRGSGKLRYRPQLDPWMVRMRKTVLGVTVAAARS
jgi:hypothetical protein